MADDISIGDTVVVIGGDGEELLVKSVLRGEAACVKRGEVSGKPYPLEKLRKIRSPLRGPLRPTFG